jgi:hypothetical protein
MGKIFRRRAHGNVSQQLRIQRSFFAIPWRERKRASPESIPAAVRDGLYLLAVWLWVRANQPTWSITSAELGVNLSSGGASLNDG